MGTSLQVPAVATATHRGSHDPPVPSKQIENMQQQRNLNGWIRSHHEGESGAAITTDFEIT